MTAQIDDTFLFHGEPFHITAIQGERFLGLASKLGRVKEKRR
jgi:hypothetical protein